MCPFGHRFCTGVCVEINPTWITLSTTRNTGGVNWNYYYLSLLCDTHVHLEWMRTSIMEYGTEI